MRCAAARALGALADEQAAPALVAALLDPDPDVRADVMGALVRCARPEDATALRRSLRGDPVVEVKTAAVRALGRLKDEGSTALLRALARDRCDADMAWEEGSWDDWLDVQVAAITALGDMGAEAAVDDLIRARSDEAGQDLDPVVFNALAKMAGRGVAAVLDFLKYGDARVRQRALAALSRAGRERLTPLRRRLVVDPSPGVRRLAVDCLDAGDPALPALALEDPDPSVRAAAVARAAPAHPELVRRSLADPEPEPRAAALEALAACPVPGGEPVLAAKLEAWLRDRDGRLGAACAALLPAVMGAGAVSLLREAAADEERPSGVRIAALKSLGGIGTHEAVVSLRAAAVEPARQIRLAALAAAAALTRAAPAEVRGRARELLVDAVRGRLRPGDPARDTDTGDDVPGDRVPGPGGSGRIAITPEGRIVTGGAPAPEASATVSGADAGGGPYPRSTLEALRATGLRTAAPSDEVPPSPPPGGRARSRRVPVEGVDDIEADIRTAALRLVADCPGDDIDGLLAEAAGSTASDLRAVVFETIAQRARAMPLSPVLEAVLVRFLECEDPRVRCAAARGLTKAAGGDAARRLIPLLDDGDALVRAAAVTAVAAVHPDKVMRGLSDPSRLVRQAAAAAIVAAGDSRAIHDGLRTLVNGGWSDSLADTLRRHPEARPVLLGMVAAGETSGQALRAILEALAGDGA